MNTTRPIKDVAKIAQLKAELKKGGTRDYMIFNVTLNTGFRISDIIDLKVKQVKGKDRLDIIEKKTGKRRIIIIQPQLIKELEEYTATMKNDEYLFPSRKGGHISRIQAYRIIDGAAAKIGIEEFGCHGMRKTFGYWHYKANKNLALLQEIFSHSKQEITKRYIGIDQDEIDKSLEGMYL